MERGEHRTHIVTALAGYLLGSLPLSLWWARSQGVDLYRTGDGNPGAWNALEQLGARRALPAFVGDGAKGLAAGMIGRRLGGDADHAYTGVGAAMAGHCFPVFSGFRGGKAIMTFGGGALTLSLPPALASYGVLGAVARRWGLDAGVRAAVFGFPVLQAGWEGRDRALRTGKLMTIIGLRFLAARYTSGRARSASA